MNRRIGPITLCLYSGENFEGLAVWMPDKVKEIGWLDSNNDKITSLEIRNGCKLTTWSDLNFLGE